MVPLSMTLTDPEPHFQGQCIAKGEYLENGASDPLHVWFYARVFGISGSNGAISGSIISKTAADDHLGMMALSCVTLASAGLSCRKLLKTLLHH